MIPCYALIDVKIGEVEIKARPVGWSGPDHDGQGNDINGEPLEAIAFHTTCPKCGNLVHFMSQDIYVGKDKSENNIKCQMCGAGSDRSNKKNLKTKSWIKDPLHDQSFDDKIIDVKLLAKFDEELFD